MLVTHARDSFQRFFGIPNFEAFSHIIIFSLQFLDSNILRLSRL